MKEVIKTLAPVALRDYFRKIQERLESLEAAVARIDNLQTTIFVLQATIDEVIKYPRYSRGEDIGFNGQVHRKKIFGDLLSVCRFEAVVETGTWTGNTTGYMAETSSLPVFSGELSYRFHSLAAQRLVDFPGLTLTHADSRRFLSDLATDAELTAKFTFFYLDAHWHSDLPLAAEIQLIADHWKSFVIMIDDFQVPGDPGYGYDDYGAGKTLNIEYIAEALRVNNLAAYFPSASSENETGYKRGCIVLTREGPTAAVLDRIDSLRPE